MIVEITEQGLQITNLSTKFCKISSQWRNYFEWPASLERFLIIAIFVTTSDDTEYERAFAALEEIKLPRLKTFFKENCLRVIFMIYTNCFSQKCQPCACVCVCVCVCACVCACVCVCVGGGGVKLWFKNTTTNYPRQSISRPTSPFPRSFTRVCCYCGLNPLLSTRILRNLRSCSC